MNYNAIYRTTLSTPTALRVTVSWVKHLTAYGTLGSPTHQNLLAYCPAMINKFLFKYKSSIAVAKYI